MEDRVRALWSIASSAAPREGEEALVEQLKAELDALLADGGVAIGLDRRTGGGPYDELACELKLLRQSVLPAAEVAAALDELDAIVARRRGDVTIHGRRGSGGSMTQPLLRAALRLKRAGSCYIAPDEIERAFGPGKRAPDIVEALVSSHGYRIEAREGDRGGVSGYRLRLRR